MREFTLTQNLIDRALEQAGSKQIVRVHLLIGPFSEEREQSIKFYWKDLAKHSFGEGAELHFERMPIPMKCLNCSGSFYLEEGSSLCDHCLEEGPQRWSGEEVRLQSIEVE